MNINEILVERQNTYGNFLNQASLSQVLKNTVMQHYYQTHGEDKAPQLPPFIVEGISMICHKLARAGNGNPYTEDTWDDIAGYAMLVSKGVVEMKQVQQQKEQKQKQQNSQSQQESTGFSNYSTNQ